MGQAAARALIVVRLSRVTDETDSPERQLAECQRVCRERGYQVVGVAEDLDVSGRVDPFDAKKRPNLAAWLNRADEYDVIVAFRIDRITRKVADLHKLMAWCDDNDVTMVSATEAHFDMSTSFGQGTAGLIAWIGEMELEAITDRIGHAVQKKIQNGVHRGGILPLGYRPEKGTDGVIRLVPDEECLAPIAREIVKRYIAGEIMADIVKDLNGRGVPTVKDRMAQLAGRPLDGHTWTIPNVNRQIQSPSLLGIAMYRPVMLNPDGTVKKVKGRKVYGEEQPVMKDGKPLQRAEPLISEEDFAKVQKIYRDRKEKQPTVKRRSDPPLLLRVMFCGACERPMYHQKGGPGRQPRYRCASAQYTGSCGSKTITVREADDNLTKILLAFMGDVPHVVKVYNPGNDHHDELERIDARLQRYVGMLAVLPAESQAYTEAIEEMGKLKERYEELKALPSEPAGYTFKATKMTFREHWDSLTATGKNAYLRDNGVRVLHTKLPGESERFDIEFGEVVKMIRIVNPEGADRLGVRWPELMEEFRGLSQRPEYAGRLEVVDPAGPGTGTRTRP